MDKSLLIALDLNNNNNDLKEEIREMILLAETLNFIIEDVIEKPSVNKAPSRYAVIGRYILPKKIFKILKKQKPGQNGEIHITDSIRTLILN